MLPFLGHAPSLVNPAALIAASGAVLLLVQWAVARPLWLDEEMIAINLRDRAAVDLAGPLWLGQSAPFGWLALQRLAVLTLGTSERALRLVPVLFGIATIATSVWIGRRWMSPIGALVLVFLCSFAQWLTFHFLELKPYSADAFLALLLPAVAVWSYEESRPAVFWIAAAIGQWFGNGALFVTPACAIALVAMLVWRDGWRQAVRASALGIVWLASFGLNYGLVLRHAVSSAFFQGVWAFAFPPPASGVLDTVRWFGGQLAPFGVKPGSARVGLALWLAALAGFGAAVAAGRRSAIVFATVPLSALLLTALRLVPFYERLTLWLVPSLYVGVAFLADVTSSHVWRVVSGRSEDRPLPQSGREDGPATPRSGAGRSLEAVLKPVVASGFSRTLRVLKPLVERRAAVVGLCVAALLCGDIVISGAQDAAARVRARRENRGLDDREAVRWLVAQKQPGDVWMTTQYGLPAIWWYAGIEGERILDVSYQPAGPECQRDDLADALTDAPRVLLYLGFRFDDAPGGFDDLLVGRLTQPGSVIAYRPFARVGHAVVIERHVSTGTLTTLSRLNPTVARGVPALEGCLTVRRAAISTFIR